MNSSFIFWCKKYGLSSRSQQKGSELRCYVEGNRVTQPRSLTEEARLGTPLTLLITVLPMCLSFKVSVSRLLGS